MTAVIALFPIEWADALNAGKETRTENGRLLAVSVKDLPPIPAATDSDDFRVGMEQWVASQLQRADAANLNSERVRLYRPPQQTFMQSLVQRLAGIAPA